MITHYMQRQNDECAIACLQMLCQFYQQKRNYEEIKTALIIEEGISVSSILDYLQFIKNFKAYQYAKEENLENFLPAIVLIKNHYIIVWQKIANTLYISNPNSYKIERVSIKWLRQKEVKAIISGGQQKIEKKELIGPKRTFISFKYAIPYVITSIIELFLFTFSMFYLFSIEDFSILKIAFFFTVLFFNCIISLLKNYFINQIQQKLDTDIIDVSIQKSLEKEQSHDALALKNMINQAYTLKTNYISIISSIIPSFIIIILTLFSFFFLSFLLGVIIALILSFAYAVHFFLNRHKNKLLYQAKAAEYEFNRAWENHYQNQEEKSKEEVINNLKLIKQNMTKYLNQDQLLFLLNNIFRQIVVMLLLIFLYSLNLEQYIIFILSLFFFAFEGTIQVSTFFANKMEYIIAKYQFGLLKDTNEEPKRFIKEKK